MSSVTNLSDYVWEEVFTLSDSNSIMHVYRYANGSSEIVIVNDDDSTTMRLTAGDTAALIRALT